MLCFDFLPAQDRYPSDPELQLRGLQMLHKVLARGGMGDTIRTTGALRAIVRAMQLFTAHGIATLRAVFPKRGFSDKSLAAAAEVVQVACDHSDTKKADAWLGILPKGFLALPDTIREHKDMVQALNGKAWMVTKNKWVEPRGL